MRGKFNNIVETVGDTPIVRINQLAPDHVTMWVKIEAFNPLGSVKDRLAMGIIDAAEQSPFGDIGRDFAKMHLPR